MLSLLGAHMFIRNTIASLLSWRSAFQKHAKTILNQVDSYATLLCHMDEQQTVRILLILVINTSNMESMSSPNARLHSISMRFSIEPCTIMYILYTCKPSI
jgi:hypothetical protein